MTQLRVGVGVGAVGRRAKLLQSLCELWGYMPTLDACVWLGTLALTKDGS